MKTRHAKKYRCWAIKALSGLAHLKAVKNAAQTADEKSMEKAADEVKTLYEPEQDDVYNIGISGKKTWRRRDLFFSAGVVIAISTVISKAFNCGVIGKECRLCMPREAKKLHQISRTVKGTSVGMSG